MKSYTGASLLYVIVWDTHNGWPLFDQKHFSEPPTRHRFVWTPPPPPPPRLLIFRLSVGPPPFITTSPPIIWSSRVLTWKNFSTKIY